MKRWQQEKYLMLKRWKEEILYLTDITTNKVWPGCRSLRGKGTMRKRRPYDRCSPNQHCFCCEMEREENRLKIKRERREGKERCRYDT